ncbi:MAG: hypothetical protein Q8P95_02345, partial [bacterium]|nr:hypothetical protein [bacterium]
IGIDISGFPDGRLDLEVTFTDLAGNSDVYRFSLQKDTVINAPQNVSLGDLAPSSADPWNVISTWNQTNINPLFSIQETGHANFTLRNPSVSGASIHQGITVSLPGNITVPTLDATRLPDGTLEYLVTFTDSAGNESRSATFTVLKDSRAVVPANISVNGGAPISNPALARGAPVTFTLEEPMALWTIVRDQSQREVTTSLIYRDPSFVGRRIMHTLPDVSSLQNGPLEVILRFTDLNANRAPEYRTIIQKNL